MDASRYLPFPVRPDDQVEARFGAIWFTDPGKLVGTRKKLQMIFPLLKNWLFDKAWQHRFEDEADIEALAEIFRVHRNPLEFQPHLEGDTPPRVYFFSNGKMTAQSFFMSTTIQPRLGAS
jgi:hypothetical protein